jgi:hypothetical protein
MNHTPDMAEASNGGNFDPQQAADMLSRTTQQARRKLQPSPPWLLATRGVLVLAALGAIWLSVRGQHPYRGPTTADIPVLVGFIVINFAATVAIRQRALAGVQGTSRLSRSELAVLVLGWAGAVVVMFALAAAGVNYGLYPTTVLIVPGLAWTAVSAARASWRNVATGVAVTMVGVVGLFAGPAGAWAVAGVGLCVVMLARAALGWRQSA